MKNIFARSSTKPASTKFRVFAAFGASLLAAVFSANIRVAGISGFFYSACGRGLDRLTLEGSELEGAKLENGYLTLEASEAHIVWDLPKSAAFVDKLILDIETSEAKEISVKWNSKRGGKFSEAKSRLTHLEQGENRAAIQIGRRVRRLRLDLPGAEGARFKINSISSDYSIFENDPISGRAMAKAFLWFLAIFAILLHVAIPAKNLWSFAERRRYYIAAAVLALAVIFNINCSSIGMWNRLIPNDSNREDTLLGEPRGIRSDEWAVFTPMTISQGFGGENSYGYFNSIVRGEKTDMFSIYAQPVKDPLLMFRPFLGGFVFFGFERGLAFFWFARWLALFLVMYELFKLLMNGQKVLSFTGSAMILLAPVVQWWGAINALAEMLIFGALGIVLLKRFFDEERLAKRIFLASGLSYCMVAYSMSLYPAAMVPLGYIFAALAIGVFASRGEKRPSEAKDYAILAAALFAALSVLGCYIWKSREAFEIVASTEYPGRRFSSGAGSIKFIFNSWGSLFTPYDTKNLEFNEFERAGFIDFFPLGLCLAIWVMVKKRKVDMTLATLAIVSAFLFAYCAFGLPESVAKYSLMGKSTGPRAAAMFGFAQILLLLRSVAAIGEERFEKRKIFAAAFSFAVASTLASRLSFGEYLTTPKMLAILAISFCGAWGWLDFRRARLKVAAFTLAIMIAAGAYVNPIQHGSAGVLDSPLAAKIRSIAERERSLWIVDYSGSPISGYPICLGAPTLSSVNIYPARERWEIVDPDRIHEDIWNRYAHIRFILKAQGEPRFKLIQDDYFEVELSPEDLARLGVRYILSPRELEVFSCDSVAIEKAASAANLHIYRVQ